MTRQVACHKVPRRAWHAHEFSAGIDLPHTLAGISEIHLALRVDDNARAWMSQCDEWN